MKIGTCFVLAALLIPFVSSGEEKAVYQRKLVSSESAEYYRDHVLKGLYGIPRPDDIVGMRAEKTFGAPYGEEIEPFAVKPECFAEVISYFENASIDESPSLRMPEMGSIVVTKKSGLKSRICWYCGSKSPLMFSVNGIRCISDKPWKEKDGEVAAKLAQLLEKMAGVKPKEPVKGPSY